MSESDAVSFSIKLGNRYGLHARPAALFVQKCNEFRSEVFVLKGDMEVNGKNILDIMMLGAGTGTELFIRIAGPDAEDAAEALRALVLGNFGE